MRCPECGEENPAQAMFCMICGTRFSKQGSQRQGVGEALRPATPVPEPTPPAHWERGNGRDDAPLPLRPGPPEGMRAGGEASVFRPPVSPPPTPVTPTPPAAPDKPRLPGFLLEQEGTGASPLPIMQVTPPPPPVQPVTPATMVPEEPLPSPQATIPLHPSLGLPVEKLAATFPSERPTTPMAPVGAAPAGAPRASDRVVCPQCYAQNSSGNLHCQECGSVLPSILTGATRAMAPPAQSSPGLVPAAVSPGVVPPPISPPQAPPPQVTVVMPAQPAQAQYARQAPAKAPRANGFGPADFLAIFAILALGAAISPLFKWMEGADFTAFSFQGVNNPGGPALLPYAGTEWLTVGVIAAVALGLALVFLLARVGRGPMFLLAGWLALAPFIYLAIQGFLPLRVQGLELQGAPGFNAMFFGGGPTGQAALTPAIWLMTGAGAFLLVAGFLAPPRGWGRLMTFFIFGLVVGGLVFFCAIAYSWNLFIPKSLVELLSVFPRAVPLC